MKIQDYANTAPSKNPRPGKFAHKFTVSSQANKETVVVPLANKYGVRPDVRRYGPEYCEEICSVTLLNSTAGGRELAAEAILHRHRPNTTQVAVG